MNLLLLATLGAGGVLFLWITQSVALLSVGEPLAWPLRTSSTNRWVKWTRRVCVQIVWGILLAGLPLVTGTDPFEYFSQLLPKPDLLRLGRTFALCVLVMGSGYALEIAFGWIRWEPQFDRRTCRSKLLRRITLCVPLALMEEAVFRGVVLEQTARGLASWGVASHRLADAVAVLISSLLFSLVHFVRPDEHRPFWRPAAGLFLVGGICGAAFVLSGHSLWLPVAIHAAGILVTETARIFTWNVGPKWLVGYQTYPHCGLCGATVLVGLAWMLLL